MKCTCCFVQSIPKQPKKKQSKTAWKAYQSKVWELTEQQDLTQLLHHELRAYRGYHLDHIVAIWTGFKLNIPEEKIASLENLRFIPYKDNMNKSKIITEDSKQILKTWNLP